MIESLGEWMENPCDTLDDELLERGNNFFIGYIPDITATGYDFVDSTSSIIPDIQCVLMEYTSPKRDKWRRNTSTYHYVLRFIGEDYFEVRDFATQVVDSITHIFGAKIYDIHDSSKYYQCGSIYTGGLYAMGEDVKGRFAFQTEMHITAIHMDI